MDERLDADSETPASLPSEQPDTLLPRSVLTHAEFSLRGAKWRGPKGFAAMPKWRARRLQARGGRNSRGVPKTARKPAPKPLESEALSELAKVAKKLAKSPEKLEE